MKYNNINKSFVVSKRREHALCGRQTEKALSLPEHKNIYVNTQKEKGRLRLLKIINWKATAPF